MAYGNALRTPGGSEQIATDTVGTEKFQRVKWVIGAEGEAIAVPGDAANGIDVDVTRSALPTGAATAAKQDTLQTRADLLATESKLEAVRALLAGATPAGTNNIGDVDVLTLPALPAGANAIGSVDTELPAAAVLGDGRVNPTAPVVEAANMVFNGTAWDRIRGNTLFATALAAADRTVTTSSPVIENYGGAGIYIKLAITTTGTGTLTVAVREGPYQLGGSLFGAVTANSSFMFYPGVEKFVTGGAQALSLVLPRQFQLRVAHSDASIWNYSLTYNLID